MRAGRLRHRIAIYSVFQAGGTGAKTETLFGTFPCEIRPQTGKEIQALGGEFSVMTHKITMRYVNGIKPSMVGYFNGRRFQFVSISNVDEVSRELQIVATESK